MSEMEKLTHIDAYEIQKYQQNRYPLLFVDEIEEAVPGESAKGYKTRRPKNPSNKFIVERRKRAK